MPQFARPSADTFLGNYTDQGGGVVNIFATIDEVVSSDADFIRSVVSPINEVYVCALTSVVDPVSSAGHTMRMRTATDLAGTRGPISWTELEVPGVPTRGLISWVELEVPTLGGAPDPEQTGTSHLIYYWWR